MYGEDGDSAEILHLLARGMKTGTWPRFVLA